MKKKPSRGSTGVHEVGHIDLHAGDGQGFDALLNKLVRLKSAETA